MTDYTILRIIHGGYKPSYFPHSNRYHFDKNSYLDFRPIVDRIEAGDPIEVTLLDIPLPEGLEKYPYYKMPKGYYALDTHGSRWDNCVCAYCNQIGYRFNYSIVLTHPPYPDTKNELVFLGNPEYRENFRQRYEETLASHPDYHNDQNDEPTLHSGLFLDTFKAMGLLDELIQKGMAHIVPKCTEYLTITDGISGDEQVLFTEDLFQTVAVHKT